MNKECANLEQWGKSLIVKKISKNRYLGKQIKSLKRVLDLAEEKKSIYWNTGGRSTKVLPAAVISNWSLIRVDYLIKTKRLFETMTAEEVISNAEYELSKIKRSINKGV